MQRRVLVTGLNMVTALGVDLDSTWEGLVEGRNGVRGITLFDASACPVRFAGQVPSEFDGYFRERCSRRMANQMPRAVKLGYVCAKEAVAQSGIDFGGCDRSRCAVVFGAADTGHSCVYDDKYWIMKTMPHGVAAWVSMEYKLRGPSFTVSAACTSSAYALAYAADLIKSDRADVVIAGGAAAIINPEHINGFCELGALSTQNDSPETASRPFSLDRDGFVIGEGAGVLILESDRSAEARGAEPLAELAGYAMTNEAHNIMAPGPDGVGMAETMELALADAGVDLEGVDYLNAHGTSTPLNDRYETMAMKQVFGDRAYEIPISSAKSMIGHTAAACGAVEGAITVMSLKTGVLTPTVNHVPDPELDLDYVPNSAREQQIDVALSNSFGFGGCNATLVFRRIQNHE